MTRRPNFFIIGAPKCGTTALSRYLRAHPNVFMSTPKEPNHFCSDFFIGNPSVIRPFDQYKKLFESAQDCHTAIGEASVWYLYSKEAVPNIRKYNSSAKLILMLRDPIEMVYSLHSQFVYNQVEPEKDFQKAWRLQEARSRGHKLPRDIEPQFYQYKNIGEMGRQVERLYENYPREQILTILFDDFKSDTRGAYLRTLRFLGLQDDGSTVFPRINPNKGHKHPWLRPITQKPHPGLSRAFYQIKKFMGIEEFGFRNKIALYNTKYGTKRPPLSPSFRAELCSAFKQDIALLSGLIHRDLSSWR